VIEHGHAVGSDGTNRELFVSGSTHLARHDGAKRSAKRTRHFRGDHHTAARDATHDRVGGRCAASNELCPQALARLDTVAKDAAGGHGYAPAKRVPNVTRAPAKGGCMGITAYVLIQTEVGKAAHVTSSVRKITGVVSADDVTGPYDVIVRTEAESLDDLGKLVVSQIQGVEGITRTFTCPVVNL
jgi:DNA-binding Lrp family transcriptional regulator